MEVGDVFGPYQFQISREQLVRYAGASDDYNPIHYDDAAARGFGLPGVIVHGMLNMGLIARWMTEDAFHGQAQLEQYSVRFRQMVQPDRVLVVTGRVREIDGDQVQVDVQLAESGQKPAVTGKMRLRMARGKEA